MAAIAERALRARTDRVFYTGMAAAIAVAIFLGFARTFYLRGYLFLPPGLSPLSTLLIFHGALASLWIAIFLAQTSLVAVGRTDLHRRLGIAGAALAMAMFIVSVVVAVDALQRGVEPFGLDRRVWFLAVPLPGALVFGSLVAAAVALRRRPETHKRLMLLATISTLGPAGGRLIALNFDGVTLSGFLFGNFGLPDAFVSAAIAYDLWRHGRVHPVLLFGGIALALWPMLLVVANTSVGFAVAELFL